MAGQREEVLESEGERGFEDGEMVGDEVGGGEREFEEEETFNGAVEKPENVKESERDGGVRD